MFLKRFLCAAAPLIFAASADAQIAFTDVTTPELGASTDSSRGVAWGDYDNDGDLDLYVTNWATGANRLFQNLGNGTFAQVLGTPLSNSGFGGRAIWADYDNNGTLDLYLVNSGSNFLFQNDGTGVFTNVTDAALTDGGLSRAAAWGDIDNDGDLDLYLTSATKNRLFWNNGNGTFSLMTSILLEDNIAIGRGVAWSDYDGDGDLDMYIASGGPADTYADGTPIPHANLLLQNDGSGGFTNVTPVPMVLLGEASRSVTWADYDNDGDLDLYVTKVFNGSNRLFNNSPAGFVDVTTTVLGGGAGTRDATWGDVDNDGDLDLYLSRQSNNKLLRNDGNGGFTDVTLGALGDPNNSRGAAFADYDNDGDLDLFFASNIDNKLLRNDSINGNHWIEIKLVGTFSNRSAVGAKIFVTFGNVTTVREVAAGVGYMSDSPLIQHVGVGSATSVNVKVVWPTSSIAQSLQNILVDNILEIIEQIPADLNGDGLVNAADLAQLLSAWGSADPSADFNHDGVVNSADLATLLVSWRP